MFKKNNIFGKNSKSNRRGQIFIVSVIIAVTVSLMTSYILLTTLFKETNPDQYLGAYQSGIIDSMADGDKLLLYVDQSSKMAVSTAFDEYLYGNPNPLTNVEGGDPETNYCGSYVYRQWNSINKDCYPDYNSQDFELNTLIDTHLDELTHIQQSSADEQYFDKLIRQNIDYTYSYVPTIKYTTIQATTEDQYSIDIFKNRQTAISPAVQEYIVDKSAYNGYLIWPLQGYYDVASCFGYRGDVTTKSGIQASSYHPGIDIPAPMDTAVLAAAPGTVEQILFPTWGKVIINHGSGLKTGYIHMNKIADGLRVGDTVKQGQIIGYVGGRGPNSANDYSPHLHFEVTSDTVSLDSNYKGVDAVFKNKYVNPMCFIDKESKDGVIQKITFESSSKACSAICDISGKNCPAPDDTVVGGAPFKFCNVYKGVISQEQACLPGENANWKITQVDLSDTKLTSDKTLKITMTIENTGDACVKLVPAIIIRGKAKIDGSEKEIMSVQQSPNLSVHKSIANDQYTTTEITCTFTTDQTIYEKHLGLAAQDAGNGGCVLPVNSDGSETKYTIAGREITTTYNGLQTEDYSKDFTFSVTKGVTNSYVDPKSIVTPIQPVVQLSRSEQAKIDQTKKNLESLSLMDYIDELSKTDQVPKGIILGLITQESGGDPKSVSPTGAQGLFQVIRSYHEDRVKKECGSWENFKTDAKCQVRVGIGILKEYYDQYSTKGIAFKCSCVGNVGTNNCKDTDVTYTGWDAALRAYNSASCTNPSSHKWADYNFVDTIMKYANSWGYASTTDKIVKEEINVGILGTYYVDPRFNVKMPFDVRLFDSLRTFANTTVRVCGAKNQNKSTCVQDHVDEFNKNLAPEYLNMGVKLNMGASCDITQDMVEVNKFVEEVNNCMLSSDDKCQCQFTPSNVNIKSIDSSDGTTEIAYYSDKDVVNVYFDYSIFKKEGLWKEKSVRLGSIELYKDGTQLFTNITGSQTCHPVNNTFRLCLNTNYQYTTYDASASDNEKLKNKNVKIPFAITVRDNIAPIPITGLEYTALPHSKNSIMLKWNAGSEKDIARYNIYLSNDVNNFNNQPTKNFKSVMKYRSIDSMPKDYLEYKSIDTSSAKCIPKDSGIGGDTKYCTFEYNAVDKDNKTVSIELKKETLYYISSKNKYLYILDGVNINNDLSTSIEKFIAVTAIDMDDNEIDNIDTKERVTLGQNMISVLPENKLEGGLTEIIQLELVNQNKAIKVSWNPVTNYIDGTPTSEQVTYKIYLGVGGCSNNNLQKIDTLGEGLGPYSNVNEATIDISSKNSQTYCVGVSSVTQKGLGYDEVFVKSLDISPIQNQESGSTSG